MASTKERERWERWYDQVMSRMRRQVTSIQRLVLCLTEARAALEEIKAMERGNKGSLPAARERARLACERMDEAAAATIADAEELVSEDDPQDPRRKY